MENFKIKEKTYLRESSVVSNQVKHIFNILKMTLELGKYSYAGDVKILSWSRHDVKIKVGKFCSLGNFQIIIDGNHNLNSFSTFPFKGILGWQECPDDSWGKENPEIGNDVWIGSDVTIYSGVKIADGAVIAGQSVVTKSVPPYAIVAGNPAKIVKYRFSDEVISKLLRYKWWDLPIDIIRTRLIPDMTDTDKVIKQLEQYAEEENKKIEEIKRI